MSFLRPDPSTPDFDVCIQSRIKLRTPHGHLHGVKGVLHDKVGIQLVNLTNHHIHIRLCWFSEQQEFGPRECLKACQSEVRGFENFEARGFNGEVLGGCVLGGGWREVVGGVKTVGD